MARTRVWLIVVGVVLVALVWLVWPKTKPVSTNTNVLNINTGLTNVTVREQDFDRPVPDVSLTDLDGRTVSLTSASRDPALILVFWRTDCSSCLQQLDAMSSVKSDVGYLYAVNVGETEEAVEAFLASHPQTVKVLIDPLKTTAAHFSTTALPSSTFIHNGTIVGFGSGVLTRQQLESKITSISALP